VQECILPAPLLHEVYKTITFFTTMRQSLRQYR
jgi:hypothetical protein